MNNKITLAALIGGLAILFFVFRGGDTEEEEADFEPKAPEVGLVKASYVGSDDYHRMKVNFTGFEISDPYSSYKPNLTKSVYDLEELNNTVIYNYSASDRIYDVRLDMRIFYRNNTSTVYSRNASQVFTNVNFTQSDTHLIINATDDDSESPFDQDGNEGVEETGSNQTYEDDSDAEEDNDPDPDGDRTHGEDDEDKNDLMVGDEFRTPDLRVYGLNE